MKFPKDNCPDKFDDQLSSLRPVLIRDDYRRNRSALCLGGLFAVLGLVLPLTSADVTAAPLTYNEAMQGDLSSSGATPTGLDFDLGINSISGTAGTSGGFLDADIFTFTLSAGEFLTSINVVAQSFANNFYAIQVGGTINTSDPDAHLSNTLIRGTGELLDDLQFNRFAGGSAPEGLNAPLGPGTYTIWHQETGGVVNYTIDYTVVPEPGAAALVGIGVIGLALLRRRLASRSTS